MVKIDNNYFEEFKYFGIAKTLPDVDTYTEMSIQNNTKTELFSKEYEK